MPVFDLSTTTYDDDIIQVKKALSHLETLCGVTNSYMLGKPISKFGWTFFKIMMQPTLVIEIQKKFDDMLQKYKENKPEEKLEHFLSDFFESKDCAIKLKLVEY